MNFYINDILTRNILAVDCAFPNRYWIHSCIPPCVYIQPVVAS